MKKIKRTYFFLGLENCRRKTKFDLGCTNLGSRFNQTVDALTSSIIALRKNEMDVIEVKIGIKLVAELHPSLWQVKMHPARLSCSYLNSPH